MKFSIIIPCHNVAETLETCLECTTAQTYRDYEIIVVDDASTDATVEVARRFDVNLVVLDSQVGAGGARNAGAACATGEVLFFVDADVKFSADVLEALRQVFERNPNCHAVAGIPDRVPLVRGTFQDFTALRYNYRFTRTPTNCTSVPTWFLAMKRAMFDEIGDFSEEFKGAGGEEYDFGYRMTKKGYSIRLERGIVFTHRYPPMWPKLRTYYHRSIIFAGILRRRKAFQSSVLTFTEFCRTALAPAIPVLCLLTRSLVVTAVCVVAWFALNVRFWNFVKRERGLRFTLACLGMDYLVFLSMAAGGVMGFASSIIGRQHEDEKPRT